MRTGAVKVRKVKGEENPADLFIKYLPSKDKVHSLVKLFGCEYRSGRAASAPLLRPMNEVNSVDNAVRLPHLHTAAEIEQLYPRMEAPQEEDRRDFEGNGNVTSGALGCQALTGSI